MAGDVLSNRHCFDPRHRCLQTFWLLPGHNRVAASATAPSASIARWACADHHASPRAWVQIVLLAHDLITWTQALLLDGELAKAEPERLRYRLLHVAGASHSRAAARPRAS